MCCAAEAKGLMQNRSGMLDCGFKRCEIGSRLKCSKVGALKDPNRVIEALDLAGAKRSGRLPCALGREDALAIETLHAWAL